MNRKKITKKIIKEISRDKMNTEKKIKRYRRLEYEQEKKKWKRIWSKKKKEKIKDGNDKKLW